jgi:asparagine synthase (glutamine-hydrolysing)
MGMGMRRLAIVDADFAKQPWHEKDFCLCFNGEIYNYQALRQTLMDLGYQFSTKSDTEVLAKAYLHWGTSCFEYLEGMFAIAIIDFKLNKLFLARDINGEKPLYYFINHQFVIWSSELKGLLTSYEVLRKERASISPEALNWYFRLGFIPAPLSIYQSILKVSQRNI